MTLKDIIEALESEDPSRILPIGFDSPHSYRGYYDQLGFEPATNISIGDMLAAARSALGATFQGYKGGDYTMGPYTDCWIAEYGHSSDNMIGPVLLDLLLGQPMTTITEEMMDAAQRAMIRYTLAEQEDDLKPEDVTEEAITEELKEIRELEANEPESRSLDEIFRVVLEAALAAGLNAAEATT